MWNFLSHFDILQNKNVHVGSRLLPTTWVTVGLPATAARFDSFNTQLKI